MAFAKQGIAVISQIKCSCGCSLNNVLVQCPECGKNLRPLSDGLEKKDSRKVRKAKR